MIREPLTEGDQQFGSAQRLFQNMRTALPIGSFGELARGKAGDHHGAAMPTPLAQCRDQRNAVAVRQSLVDDQEGRVDRLRISENWRRRRKGSHVEPMCT